MKVGVVDLSPEEFRSALRWVALAARGDLEDALDNPGGPIVFTPRGHKKIGEGADALDVDFVTVSLVDLFQAVCREHLSQRETKEG